MAKKPDMSRNTDLAGRTVSKDGYNITYNENGYAIKAAKHSGGTAAPSADAVLSGGSRGGSYGSSYDKQYLSDSDLSYLNAAHDAFLAASRAGDRAGMEAAHREGEAIRSKYGYSGGMDGSDFIQLDYRQPEPAGPFSYESAPQYVNRYQSQIDELTAQILGREAFSYNPESDPAYQQYRDSYTRGGERAMQDTLGRMAASTGGMASSYAGVAAQQTYDNYMDALADKIPELRQLAYSMYQTQGDNLRDNLSMLSSLEQSDYARYADLLNQYNADRNFAYSSWRDQLADDRYDSEWNYQTGRDQLEDQRYTNETKYQQALDKAQTLAASGDFSGYRDLGYSDSEIASLTNAYNASQLLTQQQSTPRRRTYKSAGGDNDVIGDKWSAVENWVSLYGEDAAEDYIKEHYKEMGYNSQSAALSGWKNHLLESGSDGSSGGGYSLKDLNTGTVLALGIGPISYEIVEQLVEQGKVDAYTDSNGRLSVRWANGYNAKNYKGSSGGDMLSIQSALNKLFGR